jgi:hypothetical protein
LDAILLIGESVGRERVIVEEEEIKSANLGMEVEPVPIDIY